MKYDKVEFQNIKCFEPKETFECGQCFRWKREEDGSYTGVVSIGVLNVKKNNSKIIICGYLKDDANLERFCKDYFDMQNDYEEIQNTISKDDLTMKKAISYGEGIRILNQDPWEMLISFIISAANNIPRISKCIENISQKYGEKVCISKEISKEMFTNSDEREYYLFPTPSNLAKATLEELRECNLGFRDKYVLNASKLISSYQVDLIAISKMNYLKAKKELTNIDGVGSKVADCILLFSMNKGEAFPVDTWIKKIMNEIYVETKDIKKINEYAIEKWGINAGIAQQYLFYYRRENN